MSGYGGIFCVLEVASFGKGVDDIAIFQSYANNVGSSAWGTEQYPGEGTISAEIFDQLAGMETPLSNELKTVGGQVKAGSNFAATNYIPRDIIRHTVHRVEDGTGREVTKTFNVVVA